MLDASSSATYSCQDHCPPEVVDEVVAVVAEVVAVGAEVVVVVRAWDSVEDLSSTLTAFSEAVEKNLGRCADSLGSTHEGSSSLGTTQVIGVLLAPCTTLT